MKRILLSLFCLLAFGAAVPLRAQSFPTVSTAGKAVWYMVGFLDGGNVLTARGDGEKVCTSVPTGRAGQLWKVEGDAARGYTLTSKTGLRLCADSLAQGSRFRATAAQVSATALAIRPSAVETHGKGFEIHPMGHDGLSLNQWGKAATGVEIGLWQAGAAGNVLVFTPEKEFVAAPKPLSLIPYPAKLVQKKGQLRLSALKAVTYPTEAVRPLAEQLAGQLKRAAGIDLAVRPAGEKPAAKAIRLTADTTLGPEAYRLEVTKGGVDIAAATEAGFFYALQTLRQLMPAAIFGTERDATAAWQVPFVEIEDTPLLAHRGFMLDVARYFFTKEEVKRVLDIMAFYKLNRFHWHLTDDQGWRIQIPEYPKLTEVGAVRPYSLSNRGGGHYFYDDAEYGRGCWYTLDDLREVVDYAKRLHIEIIPEIDMPGHMVAAVTAYPEFSCNPDKHYSVRIDPGVSKDVLNIGKDEVIDFLKCVLRHVAEIFPGQYVHLGGDECPTDVWVDDPYCRKRIADNHLAGVHELQPWLVEELGCYLKDNYGKDIIVWDELLAHWKSEYRIKPVAMAWRGIKYTKDAADKGFKSIAVPNYHLYFDLMQASLAQVDVEETYQGGYGDLDVNSMELVYGIDPLAELAGRESYCLGTQANLWTESCADFAQAQYQMLPRLLALSEIAWLPASKKNWFDFYRRLQGHDEMLDAQGYVYAKHYIDPVDRTPAETALDEAEAILAAARPGAVGHPSQECAGKLRTAVAALKDRPQDAAALAALRTETEAYKAAPVAMPAEGKVYRIVSAATYYKARYNGSTVYLKNGKLRFHYTPQTEPEELWTFEQEPGGYAVRSFLSGGSLYMPGYDSCVVACCKNRTVVRIGKAVRPTGKYTYKPGVLNIGAVTGLYGANAFRLYGNYTGEVIAHDDPALCYPGTWRIEEVTDFAAELDGLCRKCEAILAKARAGAGCCPSQEALDYLEKSVLAPAKAKAGTADVTRADYEEFVKRYRQYLAKRKSAGCGGGTCR